MWPAGGSSPFSTFEALYGSRSPTGPPNASYGAWHSGLMPPLGYDAHSLAGATHTPWPTRPVGPNGVGLDTGMRPCENYRVASGVVRAMPQPLMAHYAHAGGHVCGDGVPYGLFSPMDHTQAAAAMQWRADGLHTAQSRMPPPPEAPPTRTSTYFPSPLPLTVPPPPAPSWTYFAHGGDVQVGRDTRRAEVTAPTRPPTRTARPEQAAEATPNIHASAERLNVARTSAASVLSAVHRQIWSASGGSDGVPMRSRRPPAAAAAATSGGAKPSSTSGSAMASGGQLGQDASVADAGCCVIALLDNGSHEVGAAICSLPSFSFLIGQFSDTYTFAKSLSLLAARNPVEVLVPHTAIREECTQTLLSHFGEAMTFTSVRRQFFNAEDGVSRLKLLCSTDDGAALVEDTDQYLCVAAAAALLTYMEQLHGMQWLPHTLRLTYMHLDHYVSLSLSTARALGLVPDPSAASGGTERPPSSARLTVVPLVDALPRASTLMGQRMVRTSLLQPLRDAAAVSGRHDAVQWLLDDPSRFVVLRHTLDRLALLDMEGLLATFLWRTGPLTPAKQRQLLQCLLRVWESLCTLLRVEQQLSTLLGPAPTTTAAVASADPQGSENLEGAAEEQTGLPLASVAATVNATSPVPSLLREIQHTLAACKLEDLYATTSLYLDPAVRETGPTHTRNPNPSTGRAPRSGAAAAGGGGGGGGGRTARDSLFEHLRAFFTVQASAGSALDVARTRFTQQVDAIVQYCATVAHQYDLRTLKLEPDTEKLYCLSYASSEEQKAPDAIFKYKYAGGQHFALYTEALKQQQEQEEEKEQTRYRTHAVEREGVTPSETYHPIMTPSSLLTTHGVNLLHTQQDSSQLQRAQWAAATAMPTHDANPYTAHTSSTTTNHAGRDQRRRRHDRQHAQQQQRRRRIRCTTNALEGLCCAAQKFSEAILAEEVAAVQSLLDTLHRFLGRLQAMGEAVALLDLLLTFTGYASLRGCVRPTWVDVKEEEEQDSTSSRTSSTTPRIALCQLRHPSARPPSSGGAASDGASSPQQQPRRGHKQARLSGGGRAVRGRGSATQNSLAWMGVPNDVVWPPGASTLIVTGPNAGGKSTLLQQVGQLFVLAQAGCFVPAASATLFLTDTIAAHMLCEALPSVAISSFRRELVELAAITSSVTSRSLVLMDELGRSTRTSQGFTLAWATLLFLRARRVHSLSATHFIGLTRLEAAFDDVANVHFSESQATTVKGITATNTDNGHDTTYPQTHVAATDSTHLMSAKQAESQSAASGPARHTFFYCTHALLPGPCPQSQYGLHLARGLGFHGDVIALAEELLKAEETRGAAGARTLTENTRLTVSPIAQAHASPDAAVPRPTTPATLSDRDEAEEGPHSMMPSCADDMVCEAAGTAATLSREDGTP